MPQHQLIDAAERALRRVGAQQSQPIEARVFAIVAALSKRFGPCSLSTDMGAWSLGGDTTVEMTGDDGGTFNGHINKLKWWLDGEFRHRPTLLDDEHEALLRELNELCEWIIDQPYAPNINVSIS